MASQNSLVISSLVFILPLLIFYGVQWLLSTRRPARFPPGPPTLLGLGNLHQLPKARRFLTTDSWAKQYGPVTGLKFGPTNVIILNDALLIYEEIVKRAAYFSARPPAYIAQEHILGDARHTYSLFLRSDYSQTLRTATKGFLAGKGLLDAAFMQKAAGTRLAHDLLQSGDDWMRHSLRWGVSTPLAFLSGVPVEDLGESWLQQYSSYLDVMEELVDPANAPPVDNIPILRLVPSMFAEWKRKVPATKEALLSAFGAMMSESKKHAHSAFPSLIPELLRQVSSDPSAAPTGLGSEQEIKFMMGGMLDAAVDSSVVTFQIIILALATHPEAQRQAQAEIDAVLGTDETLPDKIDLDKLPYLNACVTEALRWRPTSVLGLPRETTADEDVLGYHVPKGTTVLLNQWTCQQDPDFYDQPERYMPERFIRDPMGAKDSVSQLGRKALYTFGAGRRECPGKDFFFQGTRIALAQILWAFDVVPAEPLHTEVETGFLDSVILRPKPFKVKFVPRRPEIPKILSEEKQKADIVVRGTLG